MGMTYANIIVRNPGAPEQEWRGRFLVDTGAIDSSVPGPWLESIGLTPRSTRGYELADGTESGSMSRLPSSRSWERRSARP